MLTPVSIIITLISSRPPLLGSGQEAIFFSKPTWKGGQSITKAYQLNKIVRFIQLFELFNKNTKMLKLLHSPLECASTMNMVIVRISLKFNNLNGF